MAFKSFKDLSLIEWGKEYCGNESQYPSDSQLQLGFSQRMAEALERLASGKTELETLRELEAVKKDRDYHSSRRMKEIAAKEQLYRRIRSLRGVITKLKHELGK